MVQIETAQASEEIYVCSIGTVDLAKSMGHVGDFRIPVVQAAMDGAIRRVCPRDKHVGIPVEESDSSDYVANGVRLLDTCTDSFLAAGANDFQARISS